MRTKFIVLGIAGVVVLGLLALVFLTLPKETTPAEVVLRQDLQEDYFVKDTIQAPDIEEEMREDKKAAEDLEIQRLQDLIRENEKNLNPEPEAGRENKEPAPKPKPKPKKKEVPVAKEPEPPKRRGFNSIRLTKEDKSNAIRAFVHSTQTVMVGSTLKMQLAENCLTDDGHRIRKGMPVYGEVTAIDGERVIIKITSINLNNNILPFKKEVFSRDAIEGIYVPGNPKAEVTQDAGAAAVSGANANITGGYDMGSQLAAGAANSVINATKSVTSKNIKKIKVTIKTNYQVLLMEDKKK